MSFVTTENVAPLTAAKASTWTSDPLGQRVEDAAGRKYIFVQTRASSPTISFGRPVGLMTSAGVDLTDYNITGSSEVGASNTKFLGIAVNKTAASAGQKLWVCYHGHLGQIANSKLKSEHTPLTLWASTHGVMASGDFLAFSAGLHYLYSMGVSIPTQLVIGQAFSTDVGQKLTKGFISSRLI